MKIKSIIGTDAKRAMDMMQSIHDGEKGVPVSVMTGEMVAHAHG